MNQIIISNKRARTEGLVQILRGVTYSLTSASSHSSIPCSARGFIVNELGRSVESNGKLTLTLRLPSDSPFQKTNPLGDE